MKLAIISDTHGIFRPDWTTHITGCDYLIHAGDINSRACYEKLKAIGVHTWRPAFGRTRKLRPGQLGTISSGSASDPPGRKDVLYRPQ